MDGIGWGEAANDDGSGTALVMELARVFSSPDVQTERSIRFALWNNEETGTDGARRLRRAAAGAAGQGRPAGIGQVSRAEMARHDPARHDDVRPRHAARGRHGEPRSSAPKRTSTSSSSRRRRWPPSRRSSRGCFTRANEKYATDYPAAVGPHMTNTDSEPFKDLVPAISLRENERGAQIGARLGSAVAPADRPVRHVLRQGLPTRPQRRADDARRDRPAGGSDSKALSSLQSWRSAVGSWQLAVRGRSSDEDRSLHPHRRTRARHTGEGLSM